MTQETGPEKPPDVSLIRNPISFVGLALAIFSVVLIVILLILDFTSPAPSPYIGVLSYLVLPLFLVAGVILVLVGIFLEHRHRHVAGRDTEAESRLPVIDFNKPRQQRLFFVSVGATVVVLALLGIVAYQSFLFMDSVRFCGETCHTVMNPERTAYLDSPHAKVSCTACHIGPGADFFVKSKLTGVGQVIAVATNSYPRPIPVPLQSLRPARETCEQCHWPQQFWGDIIITKNHFQPDEKNTPSHTTLTMRVGGQRTASSAVGVHWHVDPGNQVSYIADASRQQIQWVKVTDKTGKTTEFTSTTNPISAQQVQAADKRVMDCIDCHNRPTHIFSPPGDAVDNALAAGLIDPSLPFAKKVGVQLITGTYASQDQARQAIAEGWNKYYRDNYPQVFQDKSDAIRNAATALGDIYARNVFPDMNVGWNTYPNNIGHQQSPGCFRCHDGKHVSSDGQTIPNNCDFCHAQPMISGGTTDTGPAPSGSQSAGVGLASLDTKPQSHQAANWLLVHSKVDQQICQTCHDTQKFCNNPDCHGPKPQIATLQHPWPLAGKHQEAACQQCHSGGNTPDPACSTCHKDTSGGLHTTGGHPSAGCQACHKSPGVSWTGVEAGICVTCHTDRQTHFPDQACATCHSFTQNQASFQHPWPLVGKHQQASCVQCHVGGAKPSTACASCHKDTGGGLHTAATHASTGCEKCHTAPGQSWATVDGASCVTCHADRVNHAVNRACQTCHSFTSQSVTFQHPWPLTGKHQTLACEQCHTSTAKPDPTCASCHKQTGGALHTAATHAGTGCQTCHQAPYQAWAGVQRPTCISCHSDRQNHWTGYECVVCHAFTPRGVTFQHPWPLAGKHQTAACSKCHTSAAKPSTACASCHQRPGGIHNEGEHRGLSCETCHKSPGVTWTITQRNLCQSCHDSRGD